MKQWCDIFNTLMTWRPLKFNEFGIKPNTVTVKFYPCEGNWRFIRFAKKTFIPVAEDFPNLAVFYRACAAARLYWCTWLSEGAVLPTEKSIYYFRHTILVNGNLQAQFPSVTTKIRLHHCILHVARTHVHMALSPEFAETVGTIWNESVPLLSFPHDACPRNPLETQNFRKDRHSTAMLALCWPLLCRNWHFLPTEMALP